MISTEVILREDIVCLFEQSQYSMVLMFRVLEMTISNLKTYYITYQHTIDKGEGCSLSIHTEHPRCSQL